MPNVRISDLPPATLPLTGSELLELVQGGFSRQSTVDGLVTAIPAFASEFVVMTATGDLVNERVLTQGAGISIVDGGAGNAVTISSTVIPGGQVDSVVSSTNITVDATDPANPIVNLDAVLIGISMNGVTLSNGGVATSYLDETGAYSVPSGGGPGGASGDVQFNNAGVFGGFGNWDGSTLEIEESQAAIILDESDGGGSSFLRLTSSSTGDSGIQIEFDSSSGTDARIRQVTPGGILEDIWVSFAENAGVGLRFNNVEKMVTVVGGVNMLDSVYIDEKVSANADVAGKGQFWVRNDVPNVPMFTDDAGTDFVLNAAGGVVTELEDGSGNVRFIALTSNIAALRGDGNVDNDQKLLQIQHQNGTLRAEFGNPFANGNLNIRNFVDGQPFQVRCNDAGSVNRILLECHPNSLSNRAVGFFDPTSGSELAGVYETGESGIGGSLRMRNGGGVLVPVGYNVEFPTLEVGGYTFRLDEGGGVIYSTEAAVQVYNLNQDATIPVGQIWFFAKPSGGPITLTAGAGVTITHFSNNGKVTIATAGNSLTLNPGFKGKILKLTTTEFWVDGSDAVSSVAPVEIIKAADDTISNSIAVIDDGELAGFVLAPSTTYRIEGNLIVSSANVTAGFRFVLQTSLAFASSGWSTFFDLGTGSTEGSFVSVTTEQGFTFDVVTSRPGIIRGFVTTGAAATTVDFQWAQQVAVVANTVLRIGSFLRFIPIPTN